VCAQEVEVTATVGLQDLVAVEAGLASFGDQRRDGPAAGEFVGRDQEVDATIFDRQANAVAVAHLGEGAATRRVRRYLQRA
jgi:hypothetical protein